MKISQKILASSAALIILGATFVAATPAVAVAACLGIDSASDGHSVIISARNCAHDKYVKILWVNGRDNECERIPAGSARQYLRPNIFAQFAGVTNCD